MTVPAQEDRTQFIGGSDVAAILGLSPYKTRLAVWEEKMGMAPPFEGNYHTRRGNRQENVAAEVYMERTGLRLHRVNDRFRHPVYPYLTARIDRRIVGTKRLAEIKALSLGSYSKVKRTGLGADYICQMHHYIGMDASWEGGEWIIFCPDQDDYVSVSVDRDNALIAVMTQRLVEFWESHVVTRVAPPAEDADRERLDIRASDGKLPLHVVTDPVMIEALANLREAKTLARNAKQIEEDAKAAIVGIVGEEYAVYQAPGMRLSYTQQDGRATFDKKALAGSKPLDRLKVGEVLGPYFTRGIGITDRELEEIIPAIGKAALDLTQFEARGEAFPVMRLAGGE